ncbi:MAG: TIGR03435 family protein [Ignavibacteriota bacterium]
MDLIMKAYALHADQVQGATRLTSDKYIVDAIVPSGATLERFQRMLQNLLLTRFRLTFRWEERDFRVYHLAVDEDGPKLKASAVGDAVDEEDDAAPLPASLTHPPSDSRGCPVLASTRRGSAGKTGGTNCATFVGYSMSDLARNLEQYVGAETGTFGQFMHVVDDTGLTGRFDFNLKYNPMYFLVKAPAPIPQSR